MSRGKRREMVAGSNRRKVRRRNTQEEKECVESLALRYRDKGVLDSPDGVGKFCPSAANQD